MRLYSQEIKSQVQIETVDITTLTCDPANVRSHGERNINTLRGSLKRFEQQKPIVVDADGVVVAGNGTLEAAKALGWDKIDVVRTTLKGTDRTAFSIADNRTAELAGWMPDELGRTLDGLKADGVDLDDLGFTDKDLKELCGGNGEVVEDEVPEVDEGEPVTQDGDMWTMGQHRVLCGDATKAKDVGRLLDGREPFIMVTDPPYGVNYDIAWREEAGCSAMGEQSAKGITWDKNASWNEAFTLSGAAVAYVWHAGVLAGVVLHDLSEAGFVIRAQIIWKKSVHVFGRGAYHWKHEPCWYAVRKGKAANWCGDRTQDTVWDMQSPRHIMGGSEEGKQPHPTQKPLEAMARPIRNHGGKDDDVYDPFLGSGTTLIAAEQLNRKCYGIEISPKYVDVVCKRYMALTGNDPVRESDGAKFSELVKTQEAV